MNCSLISEYPQCCGTVAQGLTPFDLTRHQRMLEASRRFRLESIVASDEETKSLREAA